MAVAKTKLVIKHGYLASGDSQVTGSLNVSAGITGSLLGTASNATLAADSDRLGNVGAASYALNTALTGFATTSSLTSYALNTAITGFATTSSLTSYALTTSTTGFATTGSNTFAGNQIFNGNITVNGTGSFTYLNTRFESASIIYSSGSNQFGDATNDVQTLMGTVVMTGSLQVTGSVDMSLGGGSNSNLNIIGNGFGQTQLSTNGAMVLNPGSGGVGMAGTNQYITAGYFIGQTAGTSLTGSFSGSFKGDGTNLTGVTATAIFPTTATTNLASTDQFYINDGANKYVTYGDLLTDLAGTNLVVEGTDSLALNTTVAGLTSVTSTTLSGSYVEAQTYTNIGNISKTFANTGIFSAGENNVISVDASTYPHNAIFVKYVIWRTAGPAYKDMRAGTIMIVKNNDGSEYNIAESTTQDIGNTSTIDFTVNVSTTTDLVMNTTDYGASVTIKYEYTLI
jgi:hypothetical protein